MDGVPRVFNAGRAVPRKEETRREVPARPAAATAWGTTTPGNCNCGEDERFEEEERRWPWDEWAVMGDECGDVEPEGLVDGLGEFIGVVEC